MYLVRRHNLKTLCLLCCVWCVVLYAATTRVQRRQLSVVLEWQRQQVNRIHLTFITLVYCLFLLVPYTYDFSFCPPSFNPLGSPLLHFTAVNTRLLLFFFFALPLPFINICCTNSKNQRLNKVL